MMKTAVRYYSRSGNTQALAEAIARKAGVKAVSVDEKDAPIQETADLLFIGGGLYAYGLDRHLKEYIRTLDPEKVKKAAVFSTSWLSRHGLDLLKKELSEKGIAVAEEVIYAKNHPDDAAIARAAEITGRLMEEK